MYIAIWRYISVAVLIIVFYKNGSAQIVDSFYHSFQVNHVALEFYDDHWNNKLLYYKKKHQKKRIPARLILNGVPYDSVAVRFKGNSSFFSPLKKEENKLPYNIDSDKIIDGQHFLGEIEKLKLSNMFCDPSYIREVMAYYIAREYLIAPMSNYALLSIEGDTIGLYTSTEAIDNHFLKRHFGYKKGSFFKCDPEWYAPYPKKCTPSDHASLEYLGERSVCYKPYYESKSEDEEDWKHLIRLTKALSDIKTDANIEKCINVDAVLWMHAFNSIFVNLDSYSGLFCHNYYIFRDSFGVFQPLVWDMNMAFGGFKFSEKSSPLSMEAMANLSVFLHVNSENRPLIKNILSRKDYRLVYLHHVRTIYEQWLESERYKVLSDSISNAISSYVTHDRNSLYTPSEYSKYLNESFDNGEIQVPAVNELLDQRRAYLSSHPALNWAMPDIDTSSIIFNQMDSLSYSVSLKVENAERIEIRYNTAPMAPFVQKEYTRPKDESNTSLWHFQERLQVSEDVYSYYIIVYNEQSASCFPNKAAFDPIYCRVE